MPFPVVQIPIKYDGLDADRSEIALIELGESLQGAGKLIRSAGNVVFYERRSIQLKVFAAPPRSGTYEIVAWLVKLQPVLPIFVDEATKAIEGLVNYAVSRFTRKTEAADKSLETAQIALREMGATTRFAIEFVTRMAEWQRGSARQFVAPIGESCLTAQIGHSEHGAIAFDQNDRDAIESPEPVAIGEEATYELLISELDLKNRSCKFQIRGQSEDKRFPGTITDPMIITPSNPYSEALSERRWLKVKGKPEI